MHHVIKSGDSLKKLSRMYNAVESEIIENNPHISDFENLQPGMKINIPINNNNTKSEMGYVKPFIENYYKKNENQSNNNNSNNNNNNNIQEYSNSIHNVQKKENISKNIDLKKEKTGITPNNKSDSVFIDYSNIYYDSRTNKYYYKVRPR